MLAMNRQVRETTGLEHTPQLGKPRKFEFVDMSKDGKGHDQRG